jgi:hypothetical protein
VRVAGGDNCGRGTKATVLLPLVTRA